MLTANLQFNENLKRDVFKEAVMLNTNSIKVNQYLFSGLYNADSVLKLSQTLKQYGITYPVKIRKNNGGFELVSGAKIFYAAKLAGFKEIPAVFLDIDDKDLKIGALLENLKEGEMHFFEEAELIKKLISEYGFTQEKLARKLGCAQSTIANKLRLLKLPEGIKKTLLKAKLSERHARELLKLVDHNLQVKVLEIILKKGLSVRRTEELVDKALEVYRKKISGNINNMAGNYKDLTLFVKQLRECVDVMKKAGINAKTAQLDKGLYIEYVVRVPKVNMSI